MSLFFRRASIEAAVAGELSGDAELTLRKHLAGCDPCRAHYDALTLSARAAKRNPLVATSSEREREAARLFSALGIPQPVAEKPAFFVWPFPRWTFALPMAMAAVGLFAVLRGPALTEPELTFRGGETPADPGGVLLLYASRKGDTPGPLHLAAELPGSGEGRLSRSDFLQLGYRSARALHLGVVGIDSARKVHVYQAGTTLLEGSLKARPLGRSVDLAASHPEGSLRLFAVFSSAPLGEEALQQAGESAAQQTPLPGRLELPGDQVSGNFTVGP